MRDGIEDKELERAKVQLKSATVFGDENVQSMMLALGRQALQNDDLYTPDKIIEMVNAVTKEQVDSLAKEIFVYEKLNAAYVGKKTEVDVLKIFTGDKNNG